MLEKYFLMYSNNEFTDKNIFYARVRPDIYDKDQLYDALYYTLWFPAYFGQNWDAITDCLGDLEWFTENTVMLIHEELPKLSLKDLLIYMDILRVSVIFSREYPGKTLVVAFNEKLRAELEDILQKLPEPLLKRK